MQPKRQIEQNRHVGRIVRLTLVLVLCHCGLPDPEVEQHRWGYLPFGADIDFSHYRHTVIISPGAAFVRESERAQGSEESLFVSKYQNILSLFQAPPEGPEGEGGSEFQSLFLAPGKDLILDENLQDYREYWHGFLEKFQLPGFFLTEGPLLFVSSVGETGQIERAILIDLNPASSELARRIVRSLWSGTVPIPLLTAEIREVLGTASITEPVHFSISMLPEFSYSASILGSRWSPSLSSMETTEYAVYTYVLFGRDVDELSDSDATLQRYDRLLSAIVRSTLPQSVDHDPRRTNLFLIPAKVHDPSVAILDNYDSIASMIYLEELQRSFATDHPDVRHAFTGPGPFLVSTAVPVDSGNVRHMFFVDLSTSNPEVMAEVVREYKSWISDAPIVGVERLESLRLSIIDSALIISDLILLAARSLPKWRDIFARK